MQGFWDSMGRMISPGFLCPADRADLIALAKDGSAVHRLARRANALVLLDVGYSFEQVADVLLLDDARQCLSDGECPIFCVSVIQSMLPKRSKDDDNFQRTAGRTSEGL